MAYNLRPYRKKDQIEVKKMIDNDGVFKRFIHRGPFYKILFCSGIERNYLHILEHNGDHSIAGCVLLRRRINFAYNASNWWIYGFIIRKNMQGQGLGYVLLDCALAELKKRHAKEVFLLVYNDNARAINLYKKRDFLLEEMVLRSSPRIKTERSEEMDYSSLIPVKVPPSFVMTKEILPQTKILLKLARIFHLLSLEFFCFPDSRWTSDSMLFCRCSFLSHLHQFLFIGPLEDLTLLENIYETAGISSKTEIHLKIQQFYNPQPFTLRERDITHCSYLLRRSLTES